jgi:hypothetical protein
MGTPISGWPLATSLEWEDIDAFTQVADVTESPQGTTKRRPLSLTRDKLKSYFDTVYVSQADFETFGDSVDTAFEGVQTQLDGKAPTSHSHIIGDTTGLQTALDGKAPTSHSHIIGDTTGLQTALDGKADTSHSHIIADTTGLQTALDGKADTSHSHVVGDITGLTASVAELNYTDGVTSSIQTQIDGKAATSHTHPASAITDFAAEVNALIAANPIAITSTTVVASQVAQLALTAQEGDVAVRTDENKTYIHNGGTAGTMADWTWFLSPLDTVTSVNGQTGTVVLTHTHVGAAAASHTHPVTELTALTASRALSTNGSGVITVSAVTSTELGYVAGVTSAIQTQLNAKASSSDLTTLTGRVTAAEADIVDLQDTSSTAFDEIAILESDIEHLEAISDVHDSQITGHTNQINDLISAVSTSEIDIDNLQAQDVTHTNAISALSSSTTSGLATKADKVTVTPGSGTLTTVNAQGIVTVVGTATTNLLTEVTDKKFVTDLQRAAVGRVHQSGRITLTSGVPITTSDVVGTNNIYYTPYLGDVVSLYDGTTWTPRVFTELSRTLSGLTSGALYDVVLYLNSGTLTLDLMPAWSSSVARSADIVLQNGIYVNNSGFTSVRAGHSVSAKQAIVVGTIRTTSATTIEDSGDKRRVSNILNPVLRSVSKTAAGGVHVYDTNTWRQWAADTGNQVDWVSPLGLPMGTLMLTGSWQTTGSTGLGLGFGLDSTVFGTTPIEQFFVGAAGTTVPLPISTGIGAHFASINERGGGATSTFYYAIAGGQIWS